MARRRRRGAHARRTCADPARIGRLAYRRLFCGRSSARERLPGNLGVPADAMPSESAYVPLARPPLPVGHEGTHPIDALLAAREREGKIRAGLAQRPGVPSPPRMHRGPWPCRKRPGRCSNARGRVPPPRHRRSRCTRPRPASSTTWRVWKACFRRCSVTRATLPRDRCPLGRPLGRPEKHRGSPGRPPAAICVSPGRGLHFARWIWTMLVRRMVGVSPVPLLLSARLDPLAGCHFPALSP